MALRQMTEKYTKEYQDDFAPQPRFARVKDFPCDHRDGLVELPRGVIICQFCLDEFPKSSTSVFRRGNEVGINHKL